MRLRTCGSAREVVVEVAVEAEAAVEEAVVEEAVVEEPAAEEPAPEEVGFHHLHQGPNQDPSHTRIPIHVPNQNHALVLSALDPTTTSY